MRPLRYSINVSLDGCCGHLAMAVQEDVFRYTTEMLERADALVLGRVTYQMMEDGWRHPVPPGARPEWMEPFARVMNTKKKYVVSSTLQHADWNTEIVRGDLRTAIEQLKSEPGDGLYVGGLTLPLALVELGLIDEYELMVHPRLVGHGPTLFAGLSKSVDLMPVSRVEFASGTVSTRYVPKR